MTKLGLAAFSDCTKLTEIVIPEGVTEIDDLTFSNCKSLVDVKLSKNVERIGESAFESCTALKSIVLPDSVKKIDGLAFSDCSGLANITISGRTVRIGEGAFQDCSNLKTVYYGGSPNSWENIYIERYNRVLERVTFYYYCEKKPTGNINQYWHYVDGVPTPW